MPTQRILITDDDANIQQMLRMCLQGDGYQISTANNGRDAMEAIKQHVPDLMLLDLAMPVMDGMTLLGRLHEMEPGQSPRLIVMTAHGSVRTAIQAMRLGAADFLEKPFTPEDLRLSVASVLDEKESAGDADYATVLKQVRQAFAAGELREAEALLMRAGTIADDDAAFLNLAGVLHEAHGRIESARRFYTRAAAKSLGYRAPRENLERLSEIINEGKSLLKINLGETPPRGASVERKDKAWI